MIRFDNIPPEVMQAMCTPMHHIISSRPPMSRSPSSYPTPPSSGSPSPPTSPRVAISPSHSGSSSAPPPGLYLGSLSALDEPNVLINQNVTSVVQVLDAQWIPPLDERKFRIFRIPILDVSSVDIKPHLDDVCEWINGEMGRGRGVLVHCQQGISRSPAVVIAYLIWKFNLSYDEAFEYVLKKRACVKPNEGFVRALREWAKDKVVSRQKAGGEQVKAAKRPELSRRFTS